MKVNRKYLFAVLVVSIVSQSLAAQTHRSDAVSVSGYASASSAATNLPSSFYPAQRERTSIVPHRMMPSYDPHIGVYDVATYLVVRQARTAEAVCPGSVALPNAIPPALPPIAGQTGDCSVPPYACSGWNLTDFKVEDGFSSFDAAKAFYDALTPQQKATAYLLSTVASNSRWIVVYQGISFWAIIP